MNSEDIYNYLLDTISTFLCINVQTLETFIVHYATDQLREGQVEEQFPVAVNLLNTLMAGPYRKISYLIHNKLLEEGATWTGKCYVLPSPNFDLKPWDKQLCLEEFSNLWRLATATSWDPAKALANLLRLMRALKLRTAMGHQKLL